MQLKNEFKHKSLLLLLLFIYCVCWHLSQFLEQMTEIVQKGIEAAQENLAKDAEDQLLEEVQCNIIIIIFSNSLIIHEVISQPVYRFWSGGWVLIEHQTLVWVFDLISNPSDENFLICIHSFVEAASCFHCSLCLELLIKHSHLFLKYNIYYTAASVF